MNTRIKREFYRQEVSEVLSADIIQVEMSGRMIQVSESKVNVLDISEGGIKIATPIYLPIHSDIIFQFEIQMGVHKIHAAGSIVRKEKRTKDSSHEYGVKFIGIEEQTRQLIASYIEKVLLEEHVEPEEKSVESE